MSEKKGSRTIKASPEAQDQKGVDDLEILNPDRSAEIGGIRVTAREYRFVEGIEVRARTKVFIDALYNIMDVRNFILEDIVSLIETHFGLLTPEISLATNLDVAFIESLSEKDCNTLNLLWWTVNGPFFLARVVNRIMIEREEAKARAGQISTPISSLTGTTQSASETTPSAS